MNRIESNPPQVEIFQILDELRSRSGVSPGLIGRLYRALDDMKAQRYSPQEIDQAEKISLLILKSYNGLESPASFDIGLRDISANWLSMTIPRSCRNPTPHSGHMPSLS